MRQHRVCAGVYADGARQGAPQARQGADRFHLVMIFRETVAGKMNGIGPPIRGNSLASEDHELQQKGYAAGERIGALTRRENRQAVLMTSERPTMPGRRSGRCLGILRGGDSSKLNLWLQDAEASEVYGTRRALRLDIDAVRNAVDEAWSNGQVEGQIN